MSLKDDCKCSHDRKSQHFNIVRTDGSILYANCLAMNCDCVRYTHPDAKEKYPTKWNWAWEDDFVDPEPFEDDEAPETPRMPNPWL